MTIWLHVSNHAYLYERRLAVVCDNCGAAKRFGECDACNAEMADDLAHACECAGCNESLQVAEAEVLAASEGPGKVSHGR